MTPKDRQDRIVLEGTELRPAGAHGEVVAVLQRAEVEGLRLRSAQGDEVVLALGDEVSSAHLDLANGQVTLNLSDAGCLKLAGCAAQLTGRGFDLAATPDELRQREVSGNRRLYLSAIGLRPAGRPDDALFIELEHLSAAGVTFHLAQAGLETVTWDQVESAQLDLLDFRLRIRFSAEALERHGWLSHVAEFESAGLSAWRSGEVLPVDLFAR